MEGIGNSIYSLFVSVIYTSGALCAGGLLLLFTQQEKLLYYPSIGGTSKFTNDNMAGYRHPGEMNLPYEDIYITTKDQVRIHTWLIKQSNAELSKIIPTILFFHGNAGNIGYRLPNALKLYQEVGCNIVLIDYRGYGNSDGTPSEQGLEMDAEAVLEYYYTQRHDIDRNQLVLFGRSLGGAVAISLAAKEKEKIRGIIIENTFLSISAMVDTLMPAFKYIKSFVLRMNWNSEQKIKDIQIPILFLAGGKDELVPPSHMLTLRNLARESGNKNVNWYLVRNGTHNDTWVRGGSQYFEAWRQFLKTMQQNDGTCINDEMDQRSSDTEVDTLLSETSGNHVEIPSMLDDGIMQKVLKTPGKSKDE